MGFKKGLEKCLWKNYFVKLGGKLVWKLCGKLGKQIRWTKWVKNWMKKLDEEKCLEKLGIENWGKN